MGVLVFVGFGEMCGAQSVGLGGRSTVFALRGDVQKKVFRPAFFRPIGGVVAAL